MPHIARVTQQASTQPKRKRGIFADLALLGRTIRLAFVFSARSQRTEYVLYMAIGGWVAVQVGALLASAHTDFFQARLIAGCLFFVPVPALMIRRLHDIGRSGWWSAPILSVVGLALVLGAWTGTDAKNLLGNLEPLRPMLGLGIDLLSWGVTLSLIVIALIPASEPNPYGPDPNLA